MWDDNYLPLSGVETPEQAAARRRRRRRRRPFYRKPRFIFPVAGVLFLLMGSIGFAAFQANSVMTSLRTISTPPPEITDSTYMEEDDPEFADGPITVDTGPAQRALDEAGDRNLPRPQDGGQWGNWAASVGDVVDAASVATGATNGDSDGFTMLVMGVDARPGSAIDIGVRPDVLMLIRFDPVSHSCRMLSIPRDTRVDMPGYGMSKINHALMVGGIPYQLMVTEDFIGQPIDHYLLIDFAAFENIVDTLGGIRVRIPEDLEKNGTIRYQSGTYDFDGEAALAYARFRTFSDDGDLSRVERQWSVLASMARAAQGRDLIADVNGLVPTIEDHLRTDLSLADMATIARVYGRTCLDADRESVAMVAGSRVRFHDPILDKIDYYNVVPEQTVTQRVSELLGASTSAELDPATPEATPATPGAVPATPQHPPPTPDALPATPQSASSAMPGTANVSNEGLNWHSWRPFMTQPC